jgi:hypothetical protein
MTPRLPVAAAAAAALLCASLGTACGRGTDLGGGPELGKKGGDDEASIALGFPGFATKNTTRVGGADPTADAAGVALAVFNGRTQRPRAVTFVDAEDWQAGIAAAVFMSDPVRAPILLSEDGELPGASSQALEALSPTGARGVDGARIIRVGEAAKGDGKTLEVKGDNPFALAREIDRVQAAAVGKSSDRVIIASGERAQFAMPAAAWAAKGGDPVLFVRRDAIPPETRAALGAHQQPKIYVLGPPDVISERVVTQLRRLGTVRRVAGRDPVTNAIAFARFVDGTFGWGVIDPGHGLVFANVARPLDAAAGAPLSSSGKYGPLLLVSGRALPRPLVEYLLDIQPGYDRDPVRAVYNHGWLLGDAKAISVADQARLDALLEIVPVNAPAAKPPGS